MWHDTLHTTVGANATTHVTPRQHANSNQQLATHWQDTFETKQSNTTTAMHTEWGGIGKRARDTETHDSDHQLCTQWMTIDVMTAGKHNHQHHILHHKWGLRITSLWMTKQMFWSSIYTTQKTTNSIAQKAEGWECDPPTKRGTYFKCRARWQ